MVAQLRKFAQHKPIQLLIQTFQEFGADKVPRLAAALAYYTAFSIAPLLLVVIGIAGLAFGEEAVRGELDNQIAGVVGRQTASVVQELVASANQPGQGLIATIIGVVTLILGAAGVFGQLQDALNTIWGVEGTPQGGIWGILKSRLLTFAMLLVIGFLLMVSLVVSAVLSSLNTMVLSRLPLGEVGTQLLNNGISFAVITVLFALIYKVLPQADIRWRDVFIGAAVTSLLFTIGKYLIGLYLGNSTVSSSFGAAGSFVVLLLWIYYSAQILLLGAEFTQVYARMYGANVKPSANARATAGHKAPAVGQAQEARSAAGSVGGLSPAQFSDLPRDERKVMIRQRDDAARLARKRGAFGVQRNLETEAQRRE
jgi:membrane protein